METKNKKISATMHFPEGWEDAPLHCNSYLILTEVDPIKKAAISVMEVTVIETPACLIALPILI